MQQSFKRYSKKNSGYSNVINSFLIYPNTRKHFTFHLIMSSNLPWQFPSQEVLQIGMPTLESICGFCHILDRVLAKFVNHAIRIFPYIGHGDYKTVPYTNKYISISF